MINTIISFGTLNTGYIMSLAHTRWNNQLNYLIKNKKIFNMKVYSEHNLDITWQNKFKKYELDHGYSYWSWKPYIIKQQLDNLNNNDILCYFDGGVVLPENNELIQLIDTLDSHISANLKNNIYDIIMTHSLNQHCACGRIIRKEITDKFNLSNNNDFLYKFPHWRTGILIMIKNEKTMKIIEEWNNFYFQNYETCIHFPYEDKINQIPNFIHNGADQAVFQCILYKNNIKILNEELLLNKYIKRLRK